METKNIFKAKYLNIDFYFKGIMLGLAYNTEMDSWNLIIPFFHIELKSFKKKSRYN